MIHTYLKVRPYIREAISEKEKHGIRSAGVKYREATSKFSGAIMFSPDDKNPSNVDGVDPTLLLQYASCLTMQIKAGAVKPYKESIWLSREADLRIIASEILKKVDANIMGPSHIPDEDSVKKELIITDGLWTNHNNVDANTVAENIEEHFDPNADTNSDVLNQLKVSNAPMLLTAHKLADKALLELTRSAELRIAA